MHVCNRTRIVNCLRNSRHHTAPFPCSQVMLLLELPGQVLLVVVAGEDLSLMDMHTTMMEVLVADNDQKSLDQ